MKYIIYIIVPFFLYHNSYAQEIPRVDSMGQHLHWSLADKINKSDAVIEGIVINETREAGFYGPGGLYTSIIIKVSKVFKSEIKDTIIELITDNGTVPSGEHKGWKGTSMWGMLFKGDEGLFFLRTNSTTIQSGKNIQSYFFLYGSSFFRYQGGQPYYPITHDGMKRYDNLEKDLYPDMEAITHTQPKILGQNSFEKKQK